MAREGCHIASESRKSAGGLAGHYLKYAEAVQGIFKGWQCGSLVENYVGDMLHMVISNLVVHAKASSTSRTAISG